MKNILCSVDIQMFVEFTSWSQEENSQDGQAYVLLLS